MKKKINRRKTIKNILDKVNSSIGYSIDVNKFNKRLKDDKFLIEAARFCEVPIEYA